MCNIGACGFCKLNVMVGILMVLHAVFEVLVHRWSYVAVRARWYARHDWLMMA